jgi:hypothetical protein
VLVAADGTRGMLVHPDDSAIHEMGVPVEPPGHIGVPLEDGEHASPNARGRPSPE